MPYEVKGVVALSKGAPVTIETIIVPDPGPGEAVVDVQACGGCHTDLDYRQGGIKDQFPVLPGHEAAGGVSAVRVRRWSTCRRAGSATPTCTTARAASTTTSRSCSATRPPAWSPRSVRASPTWRSATT